MAKENTMNILFSIHLYPPTHLCGAEFVAHNTAKYLISKGHNVKVLLHQASHYGIKHVYDYEGVTVFPPSANVTEDLMMWADVLFTHLDYTQWTVGIGGVYRKPVVHFVHNTHKYEPILHAHRTQYIVYNSEWAKGELGYKWPGMVMRPPCDWRQYDIEKDTEKNEYITLINLDKNKGGHILKEIAKRMPDRKFLGVKGSYSEPAKDGQQLDQPGNVVIHEKTTDIKSIYAKTRVLIMPSKYESWGRTATEAMCSGIPVISSGTPGLRENCGEAGIYVERENIDEWVKAIKRLDDKKTYQKASVKARERSRELDPIKELEAFENWLSFVRHDSQFQRAGFSSPALL